MAGAGYGKDVRGKMSSYNTANPNATAQDKLGQRKTALTAAEGAMSQPGAPQSSRISNRLSRISKPGKMPAAPPTTTTPPTPTTKPPVGGGGTPLPKAGILPGDEKKMPPTTNPMPTTNSTSLKKKRQPVTTNPILPT